MSIATNCRIGDGLKAILLFAMVILCLLEYVLRLHGKTSTALSIVEVLFTRSDTQWIFFSCIATWCICFIFLKFSLYELPLISLLIITIYAYFIGYTESSRAADAIILLTGITFGKGASVLLTGSSRRESALTEKPEIENRKPEISQSGLTSAATFLIGLVVLLAFASWWHLDLAGAYHGPRWMGLWDNPNIYGMLMGAGVVLAIGLLAQNLKPEKLKAEMEKRKPAVSSQQSVVGSQKSLRIFAAKSAVGDSRSLSLRIILFVAAGMMAVGLFFSYSRGAWLGTAVGLLYLAKHTKAESGKRKAKIIWYVLPLAALAAAVVLFFWNNTPDNAPWYMKRMDFGRPSAQHRVAAWKAGFEMMRDYPLGVGWNNAVGVYDRNYSPPEGGAAALTMNDYLMLGTQLGLPGLVCFVAYVGLALTRKSEIGNRKSESTEESAREDARPTSAQISSLVTCHLPLQTACRAGAIMLLVAFWFDGGLFTLATASVFWILLELGAEVGTSRCDVRTAQRAVPTNNECGVRSARQNSEFRTPNSEVSSAGFTLIELLVVIGIIGILAALIMAATVRAKDQGARAVDINNLKQMTIALHLYAGDNQDYLPWSNWLKGDQPDRHGWLYTPSDNLAVLPPGESPFKVETGIFWPTLRNPKLYFCPADGPNTPLFSQRAQQISSYVMNGAVNGYTRILYPTTKLGQMPPTGVVFWETDETKPGYFNDGASQPKEGVSKRHDKGAINATFSGSVGYISFVNWYQQADSTNKNDLWCYPGSPDGH